MGNYRWKLKQILAWIKMWFLQCGAFTDNSNWIAWKWLIILVKHLHQKHKMNFCSSTVTPRYRATRVGVESPGVRPGVSQYLSGDPQGKPGSWGAYTQKSIRFNFQVTLRVTASADVRWPGSRGTWAWQNLHARMWQAFSLWPWSSDLDLDLHLHFLILVLNWNFYTFDLGDLWLMTFTFKYDMMVLNLISHDRGL